MPSRLRRHDESGYVHFLTISCFRRLRFPILCCLSIEESVPHPWKGRGTLHLRRPLDWRYHLATDTHRIRTALGYREPIPHQEAVEVTVQWERSQVDQSKCPDYASEDVAIAARM